MGNLPSPGNDVLTAKFPFYHLKEVPKVCPFCATMPDVFDFTYQYAGKSYPAWRVRCSKCGASQDVWIDTMEEAISHWNNRAIQK